MSTHAGAFPTHRFLSYRSGYAERYTSTRDGIWTTWCGTTSQNSRLKVQAQTRELKLSLAPAMKGRPEKAWALSCSLAALKSLAFFSSETSGAWLESPVMAASLYAVQEEEKAVSERLIEDAEQEVMTSSAEYNQRMHRAMANPYEYHHHLGMYYTRILPNLLVGSQPQTVDDISRLHHEEGVQVVLNLQQDHDIAYWGIDLHPIRQRCEHHGMRHYRRPAIDFDGDSLRRHLPRMVAVIEHHVSQGRTVYVHCTAGLGRAPASAIAFLFWFCSMDLKRSFDYLTSKRPCGPKWDAVRGATYDLAKNCPHKIPLEHLPAVAFTDVSAWERDVIQLRVRQLYHHHELQN